MKKNVLLILVGLTLAAQTNSDGPQFTPDGQLMLPNNYREWIHLSSGLGMTYGPAARADQGNPMFDKRHLESSVCSEICAGKRKRENRCAVKKSR